ncbi:MAG: hypothetical protein ABUS48_00795 [Pseudomonadota bacterium]
MQANMLKALFAAVCAAALVGPAMAQQQPDQILQNYHAYTAALQRGDFAAAETAAAAALAGSEARDGDGGHTAVLAFNLATLRFKMGHDADALAPAQRAFALADHPNSGVNVLDATLVLGRAELASNKDSGVDRLRTALEQAAASPTPPDDFVPAAALDLASYTFSKRQFELSREAWSIFGVYPTTPDQESEAAGIYRRAIADTGEGAAIFMEALASGRSVIWGASARDAHEAFYHARQGLSALVREQRGAEFTLVDAAYARALAWDSALRARIMSDGGVAPKDPQEAEGDADGLTELISESESGAAPPLTPRCWFAVHHPNIEFPSRAADRGQIGAVVARLAVNDAGVVTKAEMVARVGAPEFSAAVPAQGWSVSVRRDSPSGCRKAVNVLVPVDFVM